MTPQRHWLPWNAPVAPQAACWLLQHAPPGTHPLDLSRILVLVPTTEAGRLLRARLARLAPGQSLISPRVLTAGQLITLAPANVPPEAPALHRLAAWLDILTGPTPAQCPALLPSLPNTRDRNWALPLAELLIETQDTLSEGGWTLESAAALARADAERWNDLARLGKAHTRLLAQWGLAGPAARWNAWLESPAPPEGIDRILLAALPDPFPVTLKLLDLWKDVLPLDILIHAPPEETDHFDDWGRPVVAHWTERPLELPPLGHHLHLAPDTRATAARAAEIARRHTRPAALVLGCCREEIHPVLCDEFTRTGLRTFDPTGRAAHHGTAGALLAALRDLAATRSFEALMSLARHPNGGTWLARQCGLTHSDELLALLDAFAAACLPGSIDHLALARPKLRLPSSPDHLHELRRALSRKLDALDGPEALAGCLEELLDSPLPAEEAEALAAVWSMVRDLWPHLPRPAAHDAADFLLHGLSTRRLAAARHDEDLELLGWLELPWSDAPHLVLVEPQEGALPATLQGHPFLPETLRETLGLRTNARRHARDAFLLEGLWQSRRDGGRVDILLSRAAADGTPLHPSHLLLQTAPEDLPARILLLGHELPPPVRLPARTCPFPLHLPPPPPRTGKAISVTAFQRYLQDPLLYYLQDVLRWEEVETGKAALNAFDFGILAHNVLEHWGAHPEHSAIDDPEELARLWTSALEADVRARYGDPAHLTVELQATALAQRLRALAPVQADRIRQGWRILHVEKKFELPLGEWTVKGKIDRIEQHTDGRIALLDYKTSETGKAPGEAHLRALTARTRDPGAPEARFEFNGKPHAWLNLQLPLYAAAWSSLHDVPLERIECAYVQLPKAVTHTAIETWEDFTPDLAAQARGCAVRVLEALDAGRFWPPGTAAWGRDPWPFWFPGGPLHAVHPPEAAP